MLKERLWDFELLFITEYKTCGAYKFIVKSSIYNKQLSIQMLAFQISPKSQMNELIKQFVDAF